MDKIETTNTANSRLGGLHHITAVTGNAAGNVAFYTQTLGMRLVKKTVNQDDVSAYHLFYGDEIGHAGTELTFFDWPDAGAEPPGAGTIAAIGLRVPDRAALDWWAQRFDERGVAHEGDRGARRAGRRSPSPIPRGSGWNWSRRRRARRPVAGGDALGAAARSRRSTRFAGCMRVRLLVARLDPTERVLTEVMGFRAAGAYELRTRRRGATGASIVYEAGAGGPGAEVHLVVRPDARRGMVGIGGVHHVAFRTPNDEEQLAWRERLAARRAARRRR